jgi:mRNA interferase MazF
MESPAAKRRPVLILTRNIVLQRLRRVTVAEVTSRVRGLPTEVALDEDDGMPRPCVVTLDSMRVVPKAYLIDYVTTLGHERMTEVCEALKIAVDC